MCAHDATINSAVFFSTRNEVFSKNRTIDVHRLGSFTPSLSLTLSVRIDMAAMRHMSSALLICFIRRHDDMAHTSHPSQTNIYYWMRMDLFRVGYLGDMVSLLGEGYVEIDRISYAFLPSWSAQFGQHQNNCNRDRWFCGGKRDKKLHPPH